MSYANEVERRVLQPPRCSTYEYKKGRLLCTHIREIPYDYRSRMLGYEARLGNRWFLRVYLDGNAHLREGILYNLNRPTRRDISSRIFQHFNICTTVSPKDEEDYDIDYDITILKRKKCTPSLGEEVNIDAFGDWLLDKYNVGV